MPDSVVARFTYRAFISYSHRDKAWADWLHKALETYRVPSRLVGTTTAHGTIPRRLIPVFRDREELSSSPELGTRINEALAQSENLVVICSPASAASRWVNEEVLAYKRLGRAARIFCMIVDGEPNATDFPGRESEECFCPALRFATGVDGRPTNERAEPIAADARAGKDGKPNAKLKLIAGMLDVGFDALKQREQRRQVQRMTAIAGIALVVMAVTIVLAIAALVSRHRAVVAQQEAVVAKQAAVRRQKQAEGLVGFMLGDLTTKLRQVDRLDILNSVDDKALAYFKSLPDSDVNATALAQRARVLQKIGDVRMDESRLADAMDAFQHALRINQRLALEAPGSATRQNALGENLLWIGSNDWYQGRLDRAETTFKEAAAALQHAATLAPGDDGVRKNLDFVLNNLGNVAFARGELDTARIYFGREFSLDQRMAARHSGNVLWQNALGAAHGNLGNVALAQGHLDTAVAEYFAQQRIQAKAVARTPSDRQMQSQLVLYDGDLARVLEFAGQDHAAIGYSRLAVRNSASLIAFDPSHEDWQELHGFYNRQLARLLLDTGDTAGAAGPIAVALATATRLVAKDPDNADWRDDLAQAQLQGARLALARGQSTDARKLALQGMANMQSLLARGTSKATLVRIAANLELVLGQIANGSHDAV